MFKVPPSMTDLLNFMKQNKKRGEGGGLPKIKIHSTINIDKYTKQFFANESG